jgi:hypothetical protein
MKSCKIPLVWDRFLKDAEQEHKNALERHTQKVTDYKKKMKAWERGHKKSDPPTSPPAAPVPRMRAGEDLNFLRFATALKIFVSSSISTEGINRAAKLFQEYLLGYLEVC